MKLAEFVNFFDFSYAKDEEGYRLIDNQGANLGDIENERFETPVDIVGRFQDSIYEPDYIDSYFKEELGMDVSNMPYREMIKESKKKGAYQCYLDILEVLDNPESIVE